MAKRDSVVEARSTLEKSTRRRRLSVVAVVVDGDDVSTKATRDVAATNVHELFGPKKTPSFPDTGFRVVLRQMWFENIHPRNIKPHQSNYSRYDGEFSCSSDFARGFSMTLVWNLDALRARPLIVSCTVREWAEDKE